jgi:hypothetical protein
MSQNHGAWPTSGKRTTDPPTGEPNPALVDVVAKPPALVIGMGPGCDDVAGAVRAQGAAPEISIRGSSARDTTSGQR